MPDELAHHADYVRSEVAVARLLKRLYPQNPDIVLGREARLIVEELTKLGWWVVSGENLLEMLREVAEGADPDVVYAEHYANSEHRTDG